MKILFLSSGNKVPSSRFRILPYLRHFREDGHTCVLASSFPQKYDYFPWMGFRPSQLLKRGVRWWHLLTARLQRFDIVYVDREIFDDSTTAMEERFRSACRRFVVDFDDAVCHLRQGGAGHDFEAGFKLGEGLLGGTGWGGSAVL